MEKYSIAEEETSAVVVGLDVHKDTISACVFDSAAGEICHEQTFKNESASLRRFIRRVRQRFGEPVCCYEASSCGFVLYRFMHRLGVRCEVIAPSSMPRRARDRIKNDRRDAEKLATLYAAGLLTPVRIPHEEEEAVRSLLRCRSALVDELTRTRHRTPTGATRWRSHDLTSRTIPSPTTDPGAIATRGAWPGHRAGPEMADRVERGSSLHPA